MKPGTNQTRWYDLFGTALAERFHRRLTLISPPRTGSTLVARILWQSGLITHHCHEPFEAIYWGNGDAKSVANVLLRPMEVSTGVRRDISSLRDTGGVLLKEMTFQLDDDQFRFLATVSTAPLIFVIRDPRLAVVSRLRIVKELRGAETFGAEESGWGALGRQLAACKSEGIPYVVVDSDALRRDPGTVLRRFARALGTDSLSSNWEDRSGLQLCDPEVGALMGSGRVHDDPFYRRVLASTTIEPPDPVDFNDIERRLEKAGLGAALGEWSEIYANIAKDSALVAV